MADKCRSPVTCLLLRPSHPFAPFPSFARRPPPRSTSLLSASSPAAKAHCQLPFCNPILLCLPHRQPGHVLLPLCSEPPAVLRRRGAHAGHGVAKDGPRPLPSYPHHLILHLAISPPPSVSLGFLQHAQPLVPTLAYVSKSNVHRRPSCQSYPRVRAFLSGISPFLPPPPPPFTAACLPTPPSPEPPAGRLPPKPPKD